MQSQSLKQEQLFSTNYPTPSILHIKMNSPQTLNSLTDEFFIQLPILFNPPSNIKCIILTSTGKHFTSGLSLNQLLYTQNSDPANNAMQLKKIIEKWQQAITSIQTCRVPVLVGIQGGCIGGGVDIINSACIRFCTENAFFSIKEVDLAIVADLGTFPRIQQIVNEGVVREWAYTGRRISASEALKEGLVTKIFQNEELMFEGLLKLAVEISEKSQIAIQNIKLTLNKRKQQENEQVLDFLKYLNMSMIQTSDFMTAIQSNLNKTKPIFAKL